MLIFSSSITKPKQLCQLFYLLAFEIKMESCQFDITKFHSLIWRLNKTRYLAPNFRQHVRTCASLPTTSTNLWRLGLWYLFRMVFCVSLTYSYSFHFAGHEVKSILVVLLACVYWTKRLAFHPGCASYACCWSVCVFLQALCVSPRSVHWFSDSGPACHVNVNKWVILNWENQ